MEVGPREFLRAFLYSYVVTSAQLLGSKAPALRRAVCKNAARALLREHPELKDSDPVELVKTVAESLLGADASVKEDESGTVVEIEGCRICPRDLIEEFVSENPELEDSVFGYNVCAFTTLIEEVLRAMGREDVKLEHDPVRRSHCRVTVKKKEGQ